MSGVITAAVVVAGGTAYAANKSSKAQKDAANKQAEGIDNASRISQEAVSKARSDALALFNPAFADISTSLNQARGDLLAGRTSAQDILNQSFMQSSSTLQTSGQQAMNAILGRSGASQQQPQIPAQTTQPDIYKEGPLIHPQQPDLGLSPDLLAEMQAIKNGAGLPPQTGGNLPAEGGFQAQPIKDPNQTPPFDPTGGGFGGLRDQQMIQPQFQQQPVSGLRPTSQPLPQMQFDNVGLRGGNFQFNPMMQQY